MKLILSMIVLSFSGILFAQETPNMRMNRLERMVLDLEQRVNYLESNVSNPIPPTKTYWACSVTNNYDGKMYIGKDASKEAAKAEAKNECYVRSNSRNECLSAPVCEQVTE